MDCQDAAKRHQQILFELLDFVDAEGRFPSADAVDESERALAARVDEAREWAWDSMRTES